MEKTSQQIIHFVESMINSLDRRMIMKARDYDEEILFAMPEVFRDLFLGAYREYYGQEVRKIKGDFWYKGFKIVPHFEMELVIYHVKYPLYLEPWMIKRVPLGKPSKDTKKTETGSISTITHNILEGITEQVFSTMKIDRKRGGHYYMPDDGDWMLSQAEKIFSTPPSLQEGRGRIQLVEAVRAKSGEKKELGPELKQAFDELKKTLDGYDELLQSGK